MTKKLWSIKESRTIKLTILIGVRRINKKIIKGKLTISIFVAFLSIQNYLKIIQNKSLSFNIWADYIKSIIRI